MVHRARPALLLALAAHGLLGQSPRQQVENLRAFAKAYGYVKYFHPSDEAAQLDWDRFAAFGAHKVKSAQDSRELQRVLIELFGPIGPTLRIHGKDESAAPASITFSDDLDVVAWQHCGNGVDTEGTNSIYRSVRTNRKEKRPAPAFGPASLILDAKPFAGKKVKLSAEVRAEVSSGQGTAHLWLRVDRTNRSMGFFDNMGERPIVEASWKRYEIVGEVDANADKLILGTMLVGHGKAWFDQVQLFVEKDGQWVEIPLLDGDFENDMEDKAPAAWFGGNPGQYDYRVVKGASSGRQALLIQEKENLAGLAIFPMLPKPGEVARKELARGLCISFPLALPKEGTGAQAVGLEALKNTCPTCPRPAPTRRKCGWATSSSPGTCSSTSIPTSTK